MSLQAKILWATAIAALAAVGIILWTLFEWSVIDRVPTNFYMELAGIVWMVFFLLATVSLVALYELPAAGAVAALPLSLQVAAVLVVLYAPLRAAWIEGDFLLYREARESIVTQVRDGVLRPNVPGRPGVIRLDGTHPRVSMGGNEIVVEPSPAGPFVFFYTFRGSGSNFSGFLHVPGEASPADSGLAPRQLEVVTTMAEHWFHVSPARDAR